jgi:DNA replication protein DnaC
MESLLHAKNQSRLKRKLTWMKKARVLLSDEVGYGNYTTKQGNLFFQPVKVRYETGSIIITTNNPSEVVGDHVRRGYRHRNAGSPSSSCHSFPSRATRTA